MKAIAKPTSYISAYPLKVLVQALANAPESPQSDHLHALLTKRTSATTRIRVAPMINPYKLDEKALPLRPLAPVKDQEPAGNDWFKQYE